MGSSSSPGARRRRVAIIADAVAETQERIESATASSLFDVRDALAGQGFEPMILEFAGEPASWLCALREGEFDLVQRFPAPLTEYAVIVKKLGDTNMRSSQLAAQQVIPAQGETFLGAEGTPVAAGQPLTVSLTDMPHHNAAPRRIALMLALGIVFVGVWASTRNHDDAAARATERKRLVARREKLLADLVRLERGKGGEKRDERDHNYRARREEIVAALEQIYGALDSDGITPGPGNTAGVAA